MDPCVHSCKRHEKFNVRFVPEDVEKRFSKLFLWTMKFAAKEERVLVVSYTMEGYFGLFHTFASRNKRDAKAAMRNIDIDGGLLKMFATGIGEVHIEDLTDRVKEWSKLTRLEFNAKLNEWYNAG